jgi:hypothetical protein
MRITNDSDTRFRKGRFWLYLTKAGESAISLEWVWFTWFFGFDLEFFGGDMDRDFKIHFACCLFSFWLTFEDIMPASWVPDYDYEQRFSSSRKIGVSVFDNRIHFSIWEDPMGSSTSNPWWWEFSIDPISLVLGKIDYYTLVYKHHLNVPINICEHEKYRGTVTQSFVIHKRPRWFEKKYPRTEVRVVRGVQTPGKGTADYNQDDDFLQSLSCPTASKKQAIKSFIEEVRRRREEYPL